MKKISSTNTGVFQISNKHIIGYTFQTVYISSLNIVQPLSSNESLAAACKISYMSKRNKRKR